MRARRPLHSLFLVAVAGLALGVAACGRGGDEAAPEKNDRVVARVNDRAVWASDVRREAVAQGLIGEDDPLDASSELFRRVMDEVVDQKLLAAEAERRGLDSSPAAQRRLQAVRERILGDMLVEKVVSGAVSEQAVERLYAEQQRLARATEEVRVRLILAPTKEQADAVLGVLGQGAAFDAAVTVEGAATARAVTRLAAAQGIEMPISALVAGLAGGRIDVKQAMELLLARPLKEE